MDIRPLTKTDVPKVATLLRDSWKQDRNISLSLEQIKKYILHQESLSEEIFLVAFDGATLLGCLRLVALYKGVAELRDFVVAPAVRGQGVGDYLLAYGLQWGRTQQLHKVYTIELPLKKSFFASYGFIEEGFLRDHIIPGENLLLLSYFFNYKTEVQQNLQEKLHDIEHMQNVETLMSQRFGKLRSRKP